MDTHTEKDPRPKMTRAGTRGPGAHGTRVPPPLPAPNRPASRSVKADLGPSVLVASWREHGGTLLPIPRTHSAGAPRTPPAVSQSGLRAPPPRGTGLASRRARPWRHTCFCATQGLGHARSSGDEGHPGLRRRLSSTVLGHVTSRTPVHVLGPSPRSCVLQSWLHDVPARPPQPPGPTAVNDPSR